MYMINYIIGQESTIEYGVSQGSVLGHIVFIVYINSVCNLKLDDFIVTHADETYLLFTNKSWEFVRSKTTIDLNKVYKYVCDKNLTLKKIYQWHFHKFIARDFHKFQFNNNT